MQKLLQAGLVFGRVRLQSLQQLEVKSMVIDASFAAGLMQFLLRGFAFPQRLSRTTVAP